jgi:hypothetical protein
VRILWRPGITAREFDGVLIRIRAAEREQDFAQRFVRRDVRHGFASQRADFRGHARRGVGKFRRLLLHGFDDALVAVTDVDAHRHRVEIEVALVVHIPKIHALRAFDGDGIDLGLRRPGPEDVFFREREDFVIGEVEHGSSFVVAFFTTICDLHITHHDYNPRP